MSTITLAAGSYYITDSLYSLFNYEKASTTSGAFWELPKSNGIVKQLDGITCIDIGGDTHSSEGAYFSDELFIVNCDQAQLKPKGIDVLVLVNDTTITVDDNASSDGDCLFSVGDDYSVHCNQPINDDYYESSDDYESSDEDEPEPEPEASSDYQDSDK